MKKKFFHFILFFSFYQINAQVGTMYGTGMSICNVYNFSICPTQTITPFNYGSQNYACTGTTQPDVSFNIMGSGWRVNKFGWYFIANTGGFVSGYTSSGAYQSFPFAATNTITPLSYSGSLVQIAINGVATGSLVSQASFSISLDPVTFGPNSYTYCNTSTPSIAISPTVPASGGPWTYTWQPGNITGNPANVSPSASTIYTVTAKTPTGCTSTTTVSVNVNCVPPPLCSGTTGAPVFLEDFGSGASLYGPALPPGVTNYVYQQGVPNNGTYVIASNSDPSGSPAGYVIDTDHTGNTNGYMMVINSDYPPSEVYRKHVTGLCQNTTYVFSAFLSNNNIPTVNTVCSGYVYANVKFQIEYPVSVIQNSITTGNLPLGLSNTALNWQQYGFSFTTGPGQTSVDVVLVNNAPGGCGNDYVVDDISLSPCGPGVALSIVPNQTVFCPGNAVSLQSAYTSGSYTSPQYQWQYSSDGGVTWTDIVGATSPNYNIASVASSQAGMYQLLISEAGNITLPSCRIAAGPLTFSVATGVAATSSATICPGASTTLTATGATTYSWSTNATGSSITVNPTSTTVYTVTGTVGTCTSQATSTVNVVTSSTLSIAGNPQICAGQTTTLTASGGSTYSWSPSGTLSSSTGSVVVATPTITTTYSVAGTSTSCASPGVITVSVSPVPTLTLSPNTSICQGAGTSATLTASGAGSYSWNNASTLSSSTGSMVTATPNATTIYTVTGTTGSCTNTAVVTVSVNPTPTITATAVNNTTCGLANGSATVTASSATSYTWSSGVSSSANMASSLAAGNYTVTAMNGSCQTHTTITILSSVALSITSSTIAPSHCSVSDGSISVTDNLTASTYSWNPNVSTTNNATTLAPGNYSLTVSNGGCNTSTVFVVGLISGPTSMSITVTNVLCEVDSGSVQINNVTNGVGPYQYSFNNSGYSSTTTYTNLSQGTYIVAVKDVNGCVYTQSLSVGKDDPESSIDLVTVTPSCDTEDGEFIINGITGGVSPYTLSFNNGPYTSVTSFEMLGPGTYTLSVLDSNRCETGFILTMPKNTNDYSLYIPNTFTPNNDTKNDRWFAKGSCLNSFHCLIYNRWGEKIAELKDINDSWDGTYHGKAVPDGVYVYLVEVETQNGTINKAGHITVFR